MANLAEKEDIDSLWVFERLLWPLNPQTPYPGSHDGSLPVEGQKVLDPLETLAFVAANTSKITLGTSVIDMLFHNPVILARRFATLDVLSEGRIIAGLGIGWSRDEYQVSDIPFRNRGKRADEYIQILKRIWTEDIVEFKGQFYNIPASKIGPKPLQKPYIPIYLGGYSQKTFARIANHADGWICTIHDSLDQAKVNIDTIKKECYRANRDPKDISISAIVYPNIIDSDYIDRKQEGGNQQKSRRLLNGNIEQVGNDLRQINEIGVNQAILNYNRSSMGNEIDGIIDVSKKLWTFIR